MTFNNTTFDLLRLQGDPLADETIKILKEENQDLMGRFIFELMSSNNDTLPEGTPQYITDYFEKSGELPDWADINKMKLAEDVYLRFGPEISTILLCKSLPICYSCANGAQVMELTERFTNKDKTFTHLTKRLVETSQFVMNVLSPDSYFGDKNGLVTTQKIRLIHAAIRYYINKDSQWDNEKLGLPINQEDLLGTLMAFSYCIIEGLEQLEIELTPEEQDAYLHHWKVTAYILGINPDFFPNTVSDAKELSYYILSRQQAPSAHGIELNNACINFLKHIVPGNMFDDIPEVLMHHFLDEKTIALLQVAPVPDNSIENFIIRAYTDVADAKDLLGDHSLLVKNSIKIFNKIFLRAILSYFNHGKKTHFFIPPSLRKNWQLDESWNSVINTPNILNYRLSLQKLS